MAEVELDTGFFGTSVDREEEPDMNDDSYTPTRSGTVIDTDDDTAFDDTAVDDDEVGDIFDDVDDANPGHGEFADADLDDDVADSVFDTVDETADADLDDDAVDSIFDTVDETDDGAEVTEADAVADDADTDDEDDAPEVDGQAVWEGATDEPTVWDAPATETLDGDLASGDDASDEDAAADDDTAGSSAGDIETDVDAELVRIMDKRLVTMMYQPITSLLDDSVVGYEALARGPEGSPLATPAAMFEAAEQAGKGKVKELDLLCQDQAVVQARDVLLKSGHALFVNVEASVLCDAAFGRDPDAAASFSALLSNITAACPVVLEVSDRYDFESPAELLGVTMWARGQGFRVAIDDVGVQPKSLAILPLIEPDVIKLERGITSASPDADLGQLLSVVRSQSERTGAAVVCQGIETAEEREIALSFGATHVQGFAIGYPEELSDAPLRIRSLEPVGASWGEPCSTPFELVANSSALRTGTEDLILALTLDLERQAAENHDAVILSSFEKRVSAPGAVASRYEHLADELDFVVAFGEDLGEIDGVFTGRVEPGDPLEAERAIVVLTPQFSAALLARVAGGAEGSREYAYALIYDRGQVTRAARMLTAHVEL